MPGEVEDGEPEVGDVEGCGCVEGAEGFDVSVWSGCVSLGWMMRGRRMRRGCFSVYTSLCSFVRSGAVFEEGD